MESTRRPDPARRGFLADYGGINRSPNFNELNLNKRSFQVDLSQPEGLALAHRLAEWADVVVDNFRPGVMARFGLDAEALLAKHPELIVASSSANGATGPEAMSAGLASIFGATGGLSEQTGYADGPPTEIGESTDYRSGSALAVAVLAALLYRARTGEGQHVDLASREVVAASSPDALLAEQLGVPWPIRVGNRHREFAPHDVYRAHGEDEWVAVAVGDESEWAALCAVLGREELASRYPTAEARRGRVRGDRRRDRCMDRATIVVDPCNRGRARASRRDLAEQQRHLQQWLDRYAEGDPRPGSSRHVGRSSWARLPVSK